MALLQRPDSIRILAAGLFLLSGVFVFSEEDTAIDCDSLPEGKQALCNLLKQCSLIDNEATRQRCYELALEDDIRDADGNLPSDIEAVLNSLQAESESVPEQTVEVESATHEASETNSAKSNDSQRKRRGIFGRLAGAITAPVRAVLPGGDGKTDASSNPNENEHKDKDENEQTNRWEATIQKVGRVDRNVHLVLLNDGNLFEYIAPSELRFRKDEKVEVIHVETWLTEKYRLDGERGPIRDALLIPCHREDLKGNMKRKCKLMGLN